MSANLTRHRILFFAEAVSLAHVTRPLVLAQGLDTAVWDIHFACADAYSFCLAAQPFTRHHVHSISPETFLQRLSSGSPLYTEAELRAYVECDLELLDKLKPDIVAGDFRLSLAVSARLRKIPYLALTNAHWSPYSANHNFPFPEHPTARLFGVGLAGWMFQRLRPMIFALHARPMNRVRAHYGMPAIADLRNLYTDGDWTLYADTPGLVPTENLPPRHRYIGPLIWSPDIARPDWWSALQLGRPTIYVTLGSTGQVLLLPEALAEMSDIDANLVVATAGRIDPAHLPAGVRAADYLPGLEAAARSDLVICNGGSATVYQALSAGKPVVGVCSNMDQYLTMNCVEAVGAGLLLRAGQTSGTALRDAALKVLGNPRYTAAARKTADDFLRLHAPGQFARITLEALAHASSME